MGADIWSGKNAIVTGAASGIGFALAWALAQRGVTVHLADIHAERLERAAAAFGSRAHPHLLDVRDAPAVRDLVGKVAQEDGRLDFLFNNAGVVIGGETHEMAVEHFDRLIDINIRGVVHGVAAAYPIMVRQRHGHIVNTASLAGVSPVPLMVAYTMSKHAIVGLTTSLRIEAANHGVRVCAICPASVETPLIDAKPPAGLPPIPWQPDLRKFLERGGGPVYPADLLAEEALRGIEKDRALIFLPARARHIARLHRFAPALAEKAAGRVLAVTLRERAAAAPVAEA